MKPLSERLKTFPASQFIDWLCLACVDVREVRTPEDAQEEINKIREALTERLSTLQEQLTATTNSLTNAQEALKSAGIEADTVQAGVMELVSRMNKVVAEMSAMAESRNRLGEFILEEIDADYPLNMELETPSTDAYLNAVRAEGLDMAAAEIDRWVGCGSLAREIRQKSIHIRADNAGKDGSHE